MYDLAIIKRMNEEAVAKHHRKVAAEARCQSLGVTTEDLDMLRQAARELRFEASPTALDLEEFLAKLAPQ